jgi:hypothetical protein
MAQATDKDKPVQSIEQSPVLDATQVYLNQFNHKALDRMSVEAKHGAASNKEQQLKNSYIAWYYRFHT